MKRLRVLLVLILFIPPMPVVSEEQVYFNLKRSIVHKMSCHWGQKCTKSCIIIPRTEAYERGGRGCKICGG